jgi:hypothetical protein
MTERAEPADARDVPVEWLTDDEIRNLRAWCDAMERYPTNPAVMSFAYIGWVRRLLDQAEQARAERITPAATGAGLE